MKQGDFFDALKSSVQIDEGLALRFIKIQYDTQEKMNIGRASRASRCRRRCTSRSSGSCAARWAKTRCR